MLPPRPTKNLISNSQPELKWCDNMEFPTQCSSKLRCVKCDNRYYILSCNFGPLTLALVVSTSLDSVHLLNF